MWYINLVRVTVSDGRGRCWSVVICAPSQLHHIHVDSDLSGCQWCLEVWHGECIIGKFCEGIGYLYYEPSHALHFCLCFSHWYTVAEHKNADSLSRLGSQWCKNNIKLLSCVLFDLVKLKSSDVFNTSNLYLLLDFFI